MMKLEKHQVKTFLGTLNNYAAMYAAGNKNVLPAMGRIAKAIESSTGKTVTVSSTGKYVIE